MGLGEFAAFNWNCTVGFEDECREFLQNYNKESTMAKNWPIDLSEKELATIFKLRDKMDRRAGLRAKQWQSQKFSEAKEKNGYKWSQCIDPAMVECLEFMRTTLYIHEKKTTVLGSMVREVEEVLGSSTNWSKHFYKQFHHEMAGSRIHKKSILGSHICMIFAWYREVQGRC
ncbi:unnamed protein product [Calypogeia fissa]